MQHLLNLLAGLGESLGALGSAPQYSYPQRGDRRADAAAIRGDFRQVGDDLDKTARRALNDHHKNDSGRSHGKVHHRPNQG